VTRLETVNEFLAQKRIAVVGVSRNQRDFSRSLFRDLRTRGYDAVPVNPNAAEVEGVRCYASVLEISPPVDAVLLMIPKSAAASAARECMQAGIKRVWMYGAPGAGRGAVSQEALDVCEKNGAAVVAGHCPYMFLPGAGLHRIHAFFLKLFGKYPK